MAMWRESFCEVVKQAREKNLTSDEHFTVDGTLIEAWASLKSFQRKDQKNPQPDDSGNPSIDFHGETHGLTKRMNRPPIRIRCERAKVAARKPSRVTPATCWWRTATG